MELAQNGLHVNGTPDVDMEFSSSGGSLRFSSGLILPPPEIKCTFSFSISSHRLIVFCAAVIDRTALFVARSANPPQFEDKIREGQRSDPKFSFLNSADPYHAYYRHRMDKVVQGDFGDDSTPDKEAEGEGENSSARVEVIDLGKEPLAPDFIMDMPNISSIDLYVSSPLSHFY